MTKADAKIDLNQLLAGAQIPALPQSAIRLLELSQGPENGPAEFTVPIEADPGLTSQVLKFVNSSYFGFSRKISSVKLAVTLVGIRTIKNFALWSAVFSLMPNPKCGPFDLNSLWQDSFRRGLFARTMAKVLGATESEDFFAAALLQDMAVPLLAKELPAEYTELLETRQATQKRLSVLEAERFGWTHSDAAAAMARMWRLPEELGKMIESHTRFDELVDLQDAKPGQLAVSLSAFLPAAQDSDWSERENLLAGYGRLRGNNSPDPTDLLARIDKQYKEFAAALKLGVPARSLVDMLHDEPVADGVST